jgi:hypothetical protein|tara:strand:+ start:625 stop:864 length:240 start_codon:yes stop_codon:yes gene_type:complete
MIFVSSEGKEYRVPDYSSYLMNAQDCGGIHVAGVKQEYYTVLRDVNLENKSGTLYVHMWSNEKDYNGKSKRYSSSYNYN